MAAISSSSSVLLRIVASSVAIARKSGSAIRGILQTGDLKVVDKGQHEPGGKFDPQTEADRAAQRIIIGSLTKQFPGLKIIGEEEDCDVASEESLVTTLDEEVMQQKCPDDLAKLTIDDLIVWVDPLDGTAEFTEGNLDHVTVLIGISALGRSVAGVIHQPFFQYKEDPATAGRTIWGIVGLKAFGIEESELAYGRRIVTTTKSHSNKAVMEAVEAVDASRVIRTGGSGYKVIQVIEGVADAYVFASPGCKKWDTCASESVLRALGGTLTDILGNDIAYDDLSEFKNLTGVLATRCEHSTYVDKIPNSVKEELKKLLKKQ
eukprot:gene20127-22099_t